MKLSVALLVITVAAIGYTQSAPSNPAFFARRRLAQADPAPPVVAAPSPTDGSTSLTTPSAEDALAARLSQTLSPAEICAAATQLYGSTPPQCAGVDTAGIVKKVRTVDVPKKGEALNPADKNDDGTVDILDGPIDVAPLTSGVEDGVGGRVVGRAVVAVVVGGVAAASLLLA